MKNLFSTISLIFFFFTLLVPFASADDTDGTDGFKLIYTGDTNGFIRPKKA